MVSDGTFFPGDHDTGAFSSPIRVLNDYISVAIAEAEPHLGSIAFRPETRPLRTSFDIDISNRAHLQTKHYSDLDMFSRLVRQGHNKRNVASPALLPQYVITISDLSRRDPRHTHPVR
jgi:hypothetical protein